MKTRLALTILFLALLALCAWGQTFQRSLPFLAKSASSASVEPPNPSQLTNVLFWWTHGDLDTNNYKVSVNWTDRINGAVYKMGAATKQPTNTALGMRFQGGTYLTNDLFNGKIALNGTNGNTALWVSFTFENPANYPMLVGKQFSQLEGLDIFNDSKMHFQMRNVFSTADYIMTTALPSSTLYDVIIMQTNKIGSDPLCFFYTNGIYSWATNIGTSLFMSPDMLANDGANEYMNGYVTDVAWFTNLSFDTLHPEKLHTWRTNRYKGR